MRVAAGILLLLIVAVAIALTLRRSTATRAVMLSNGVQVELLGVSVGRTNFTTEKAWHKTARQILPARLQRWIPARWTGSCGSSNSITAHFLVTGYTNANDGAPWTSYETVDDSGFICERTSGYCSSGISTNARVYSLTLGSFPRRQPSFTFNLLRGRTNIATFRLQNPIRGPFPQWTPSPMPQTKTNGPVVLTLESLQLAGSEPSRYLKPKWKLTSDDPLWAKARARSYRLFDATGNEGSILSTREPAWLVRAIVHREKDKEFTSSERLTVTNLAVPGPGEFIELDQTVVVSGVEVKLLVFAGAGDFVVSNGVRSASPHTTGSHSTSSSGTWTRETWGGTKPFLLIEVIGAQDGDQLRVRPTHDPKANFQDTGYYGGGKRTYRLPFNAAADEKTISFNVILSRPRIFEFVIDPKVVQPPAR